MPPTKPAPPPSQWSSARLMLLAGAALALACLAFFLHRRGSSPQASAHGASKAEAAPSPRSHRPADVAARPRAGISGHVRDRDGKPLAGAQVCVWASGEHSIVTAQAAPRCAKADEGGAYALGNLFPGTALAVSAFARTFAPVGYRGPDGKAEIRLGEGEQRSGVDLVLGHPGVEVSGSVVDVTGGAVSGAIVMSEDGPDRAVTTSDAKGAFTLWVEPGRVSVEAAAPGYARGTAYGTAPGHFFTIHLVPGATLVGRTVNAGSDEPVAGVFVEGIQVEGSWMRASARTDEEGRFRIEGLSPGRYRVEATSEGREGYSKTSTTLAMGETSAEILVQLDPAYVVQGRVLDKATGEACKGGQVTITDRKQNEYSQAAIEPDGKARMASVIPGTYRVQVSCQDHVPRDDYPELVVANRDLPPQSWEVDRGAGVRVEVVDGQGQAVAKANVYASPNGPNMPSGYAEHADTDGSFHLAGLKAGEYNVIARMADGTEARKTVTVAQERDEHVKLELPATGTIDGVVEDSAHRPVANVQVVASGQDVQVTMSVDDGTFSLGGLRPGDYEVSVQQQRRRAPDDEQQQQEPQTAKVTVTAGSHAKATLTVEARSGVIQGRVVDSTGAPVTDAFIAYAAGGLGASAGRYDMSRAPIVTDTDGRFTVDGLAEGEYGLRAYRTGANETVADHVITGTRDVVMTLTAGGSISGTLLSGSTPAERFYLTVRDSSRGFWRQELFFHAGGVFEMHDLAAGTYKLVAESPLGQASADVTLADGEQKVGITLALTLRGTVEGRLVTGEGGVPAPVAGMQLRVFGESDAAIMTGYGPGNTSGADGRFHLEGVLPGSWMLVAVPATPGFEPAKTQIVVQEGGGVTDVGDVRVTASAPPNP